ncbi:hypothetical protein LXA43DRAFT_633406 [Ganoderma leucocontextum]|nr:hypothetical protein LXA43DRAFT_633406 [Ganoderma leucocontextum]
MLSNALARRAAWTAGGRSSWNIMAASRAPRLRRTPPDVRGQSGFEVLKLAHSNKGRPPRVDVLHILANETQPRWQISRLEAPSAHTNESRSSKVSNAPKASICPSHSFHSRLDKTSGLSDGCTCLGAQHGSTARAEMEEDRANGQLCDYGGCTPVLQICKYSVSWPSSQSDDRDRGESVHEVRSLKNRPRPCAQSHPRHGTFKKTSVDIVNDE